MTGDHGDPTGLGGDRYVYEALTGLQYHGPVLRQPAGELLREFYQKVRQLQLIALTVAAGTAITYWELTVPSRDLVQPVSVYRSIDPRTGTVQYVGITNSIERRAAEHLRRTGITIRPIPGLQNLSRTDARAAGQAPTA